MADEQINEVERSARRRFLGRRRRYILGFWILQSIVAYAAVPAIMSESFAELADLGPSLIDPDFMLWGVTIVAAMTMLQLVFVLPVRPPLGRTGDRARVPIWTRLLLAASIATPAGIVGVGLLVLWETYDTLPDPFGFAMLDAPVAFWLGWVVGLIPAIPVVGWLCKKELPPIISACVAGCMTALLVFAGVMAIGSILDHTTDLDTPTWARATMVLGPFLIGWIVATPLLLAFIRKQDAETALKRLASLIFIGTAVETLAIIPLDVFVRRKTGCYCSEGTYLALVTLVPLGFVALGPMIFLVAASKRRKRLIEGRCEICGYDMSAIRNAPRCPECGSGWKPVQAAAAPDEM